MKLDKKKYPAHFFLFTAAYIPALILGIIFLLMPTAQFYTQMDFWLALFLTVLPLLSLVYYINSKFQKMDRMIVACSFIVSLAFLYFSLFTTLGF